MKRVGETRRKDRGVALIIVLLMTASLSFLALGFSETLSLSVRRAANSADRARLFWTVLSAEAAATAALRQALAAEQEVRFTPTHPLFLAPIDLPLPEGFGTVEFADATRCFNLNRLGASPGEEGAEEGDAVSEAAGARRELATLFTELGAASGDAERLVGVIADWIDQDNSRGLSGAEDDFYLGLPSPFRTGAGPIADVSELRAMEGVAPDVYRLISPFLCAAPDAARIPVNVNMLQPFHAPLLAAMTDGGLSQADARNLIAARPPQGWASAAEFWALEPLAALELDETDRSARAGIRSDFVEARLLIGVNEIDIEARLLFQTSGAGRGVSLIAREFGAQL